MPYAERTLMFDLTQVTGKSLKLGASLTILVSAGIKQVIFRAVKRCQNATLFERFADYA